MHQSGRIVGKGTRYKMLQLWVQPEVYLEVCGELNPTADGWEKVGGKKLGLLVTTHDGHVSSLIGAMTM